jgi:hypothetical protein
MKATPSVARATVPKKTAPRADGPASNSDTEFLELSPDQLNNRAVTSTRVMADILEQDKKTYSFRHWGINE